MYSKPKEKRTSISVFPSTKRKLEKLGTYKESMDDIILRIIDEEQVKENKTDKTYKEKIEDLI